MSILLVIATVTAIVDSALIGGVFFAFSSFIMKALDRMPSSEGILAMQTINITVLNPGFLGAFMGTALIGVMLAIAAIVGWDSAYSPYLLCGAVAYLGGTWFVTVLGNVPLNNKLAAVKPEAPESTKVWGHFLEDWTRLNTRRAGAAVLAAALFSIGLIYAWLRTQACEVLQNAQFKVAHKSVSSGVFPLALTPRYNPKITGN